MFVILPSLTSSENYEQCGDFWMNPEELNRIIGTILKFNICGLGTSYRLKKDIPDLANRISTFIPEALRYSSLFWVTHLLQTNLPPDSEEVLSAVSELLKSPKALFWLEVLSLLGAVGRGIALLRECTVFFVVCCSSSW